jgi:hypothetical protein
MKLRYQWSLTITFMNGYVWKLFDIKIKFINGKLKEQQIMRINNMEIICKHKHY